MHRLQLSQRGTKFSNAWSIVSIVAGYCCDGPHCHSYLEASCAIFRISTGVAVPETVAITNSRSKEAFDRPCDETGAAAERSGRMQIAWPSETRRCTQSALSVGSEATAPTSTRCMRGTPRVLTDERG